MRNSRGQHKTVLAGETIPSWKKTTLPYRECYSVAGTQWLISTNFQPFFGAVREAFSLAPADRAIDFRLSVSIDTDSKASPPWPKPYFRGLDHLVFAGYSAADAMLIDLRRRRAIAHLSHAMACDRNYWNMVIFPALLGVCGSSIGVTVLHCACVVRDGTGLLLAGDSGSGKSTLALVLSRCGFDFLSDDWTYVTARSGVVKAWGLPVALKLLPDARIFFPELHQLRPAPSLNGELAYQFHPEAVFAVRRVSSCEPGCVVFLERGGCTGFTVADMSSVEGFNRFERFMEDLPPELSHCRDSQRETIEKLAARPCMLVRYDGEPHAVARSLIDLYDTLHPVSTAGCAG